MAVPLADLSKYDLTRVEYDRAAIAGQLPHRDALALLDGVSVVDEEEKIAVGFLDVREDQFWVSGHFPGNPVLPGVLLVEASAQLSTFGFRILVPETRDKLMLFGGTDRVRFRGMVKPGDRVWLVAKILSFNKRIHRSATQALVGDRIVYEGEVLGVDT